MANIFDFRQTHESPSHDIASIKYSRIVTYWGGFHNFTKESGHRFQKALMPNFDLVLFPRKALLEDQHFGLGTYFTNPLAPLAAIVNFIGTFLYEEIEKDKEKEEPYAGLVLLYALLWILRAPLDLIVLAIDFAKMLLTYALVAAALIVASPVLVPVMIVRASRRAKAHESAIGTLEQDHYYVPPTEMNSSPQW